MEEKETKKYLLLRDFCHYNQVFIFYLIKQEIKHSSRPHHADIYVESKMVCPLADDFVSRVADIGHLVLEDVIATRSISVLVKHHSSSCAACLMERNS